MKTTYIFPLALLIAVLVVGGVALTKSIQSNVGAPATLNITQSAPPLQKGNSATTTTTQKTPSEQTTIKTPVAPAPTTLSPSKSLYTLATVATHNSIGSCWTVVSGNVYDLTAWINKHPGGAQAILSMCGTDGTASFRAKHGGQTRPERELAEYKLGVLIK